MIQVFFHLSLEEFCQNALYREPVGYRTVKCAVFRRVWVHFSPSPGILQAGAHLNGLRARGLVQEITDWERLEELKFILSWLARCPLRTYAFIHGTVLGALAVWVSGGGGGGGVHS